MKMASNQKMQENKPTLKFNFTIEKRWPVSIFELFGPQHLSHWALLFTAFLVKVLKILPYTLLSKWSLVSSWWEHVNVKCTPVPEIVCHLSSFWDFPSSFISLRLSIIFHLSEIVHHLSSLWDCPSSFILLRLSIIFHHIWQHLGQRFSFGVFLCPVGHKYR